MRESLTNKSKVYRNGDFRTVCRHRAGDAITKSNRNFHCRSSKDFGVGYCHYYSKKRPVRVSEESKSNRVQIKLCSYILVDAVGIYLFRKKKELFSGI